MKAPDKIYLPNDIDLVSAAILTHSTQPEDVEYIRKDALLEWAENWDKYKLRTDDGFLYAMERLIDKINSL